MYSVNIYDSSGSVIDQLTIDDDIQFLDGRVSKGTKCYYKGIGIPYEYQYLHGSYDKNEYEFIESPDIFYMGDLVSKNVFKGKFGIFQEKYQPQFEDFIGTCGVKELDIIGNSIEFERSSVKIIKSHLYDVENRQYYFEVDYSCKRVPYIENGTSKRLYELLEYMISENWNFIWDKNSITDVSCNGLVTDVGDVFRSSELKSKVGTIYSILYSLCYENRKKFRQFISYAKLKHEDGMDFVFNTIKLLERYGVDTSPLKRDTHERTYINTVLNYLVIGKNCGHCSYVGLGDEISKKYVEQTKKQLGIF